MFLQPLIDAVEPAANSVQMPAVMSEGAESTDWLYYGIYWFSVVFVVGITGAMLYFVWKYRRRPGVKAAPTKDHTGLELFWTILPLGLCVVLFHVSYKTYINNAIAADNSLEIRVRGQRWSWSFQYPNGESEPTQMWVPLGKPVRLVMSSSDVLHSFFVPGFRLKKDTVPGMYSQLAFTPNKLGEAQVFCAEYCGAGAAEGSGGHYSMLAVIKVVTPAEFEQHMKEISKMPDGLTPEKWGEELFVKNNCATCHSRDGSPGTGPSFKGLFGTKAPLTTGEQVDVDENYLRESILRPQAKIVKGFETGNMPPFVFSEDKLDALIAYLKSVK